LSIVLNFGVVREMGLTSAGPQASLRVLACGGGSVKFIPSRSYCLGVLRESRVKSKLNQQEKEHEGHRTAEVLLLMEHDAQRVIDLTKERIRRFFMNEPNPVADTVTTTDPLATEAAPAEPAVPDEEFLTGYDVVTPKDGAILLCAHLTYEVNRAYCETVGAEPVIPWKLVRDSCIARVKAVLANPAITAAESHEGWVKFKTSEGWVLGRQKDAVAKTHPYLVPFDMLRPSQQAKDAIFLTIVKTFFGL
jgi:hypothetical protein